MASGIEDIVRELEKPTILNVGAEIKRNYAKLRQLLDNTDPPLNIAERISDEEFENMASRAVKERKLYLKLADGKEHPLEFNEIDRRFNTLPEKSRKNSGANSLDIAALIPDEDTIRKVATTVHTASEEKKGMDIGILLSAVSSFIISFIGSLFGKEKGLSLDEAKAQAATPAVQRNIAESLDRLAQEDIAAKTFLNQKDGNGASVKQQIIARVPKAVYEHLEVPVPSHLNLPEEKNPITSTKIAPASPITTNEVITAVRDGVLSPQKENGTTGNLGKEIAGLIFAASGEKVAQAQNTYMKIDKYKHPLDYGVAYAAAQMTEDFALKPADKTNVENFGKDVSLLIADSFEKSITDPKAKSLGKEELANLIVKNLSDLLDKEKDKLKIVKDVKGAGHYGGKLANIAGIDIAKQLPPTTGNENEYVVVTLDTPYGKSTLKDAVLNAVRVSVTDDENYSKLSRAARNIARNINQESQVAEEPQKPPSKKELAFKQARNLSTNSVSMGATYSNEAEIQSSLPVRQSSNNQKGL